MIEDSKLVTALRDSDAITESDLERGLELCEETGRPLYHTLIDHDLADELATVRVAADLLNVPFVDLRDVTPPEDVIEKVPPSLAFRNMVFPLKIGEDDGQRELFLAMADPIDVLAMDEVATHTGIDIRPVLAGPRDLRAALDRAYDPDRSSAKGFEEVEPFDADFDLDEISSLSDGSDLNEDSWEAFFDEAEGEDEEQDLEDSMVLSREMRDRRTSQELEPFENIEESEPSEIDEDDALQSLEEPLSQSQMTGGVEADLSEWEIDQRLEGEDDDEEEKDYAAIGSFFVYSSEDARKQRLQDLADFKEEDEESGARQRSQSPQQGDRENPAPAIERPDEGADAVSGVTSMSKAPFMYDEESEVTDESDDHAPAEAPREDAKDGDGGTSMVGGPFGMGTDRDGQDDALGEESSGGHTTVGGSPFADDPGETVEGEVDVLDEEDVELLDDSDVELVEEPDIEEDDIGDRTQFGVGPQDSGGSGARQMRGERAEDHQESVSDSDGDVSGTPLAQITPRKVAAEDDEDDGEDTKSRLSGLLKNIRKKNRARKSDAEESGDDIDEDSEGHETATDTQTADQATGQEKETAENPVAKAQRVQDEQTAADSDNIRETRPNKAVTVLRAQAMQKDSGIATVFARHVEKTSDLSEEEIAALAQLSSDELIYVTLLALFEKGVLEPQDILAQFADE